MLILTIPLNKSIRVTDSITITVKQVRSNKVKLGIDAPEEVPITREELLGKHACTSLGSSMTYDEGKLNFKTGSLLEVTYATFTSLIGSAFSNRSAESPAPSAIKDNNFADTPKELQDS